MNTRFAAKRARFVVSVLVGLVAAGLAADRKSPPSFGLYLIEEPVDSIRRVLHDGTGEWSRVTLKLPPVVSGADISAYDFTNHLVTLTRESFGRLRTLSSIPGTPFVAVANGERIYLGAFTTSASSIPLSVPCITVPPLEKLPASSVRISLGYPGPYRNTNADRRFDERIRKALSTLGKLQSAV
jgi:hypothetical protein